MGSFKNFFVSKGYDQKKFFEQSGSVQFGKLFFPKQVVQKISVCRKNIPSLLKQRMKQLSLDKHLPYSLEESWTKAHVDWTVDVTFSIPQSYHLENNRFATDHFRVNYLGDTQNYLNNVFDFHEEPQFLVISGIFEKPLFDIRSLDYDIENNKISGTIVFHVANFVV